MGASSTTETAAVDNDSLGSLDIAALSARYRDGSLSPLTVVESLFRRIEAYRDPAVWISLVDRDRVRAAARSLPADPTGLPLWGIPFAVKDNIDVDGMPTTAACPAFDRAPSSSAAVVEKLERAGAILIGKTNLDQFATGLNGTRSPYGAPRSPFDDESISGGSSSGSAVAVSAGLVTFALGTDTAGSGRVPAAFTNTVGVKPSRGLVSTEGILPACRSLDCPSIFTLTVADGAAVLAVAAGYDRDDPWSRDLPVPAANARPRALRGVRLGIPLPEQLHVSRAHGYDAAWTSLLARLRLAGVELVPTDLEYHFAAGELLYRGPWLAERLSSVEEFLVSHAEQVHPVTRAILESGRDVTATDVFRGAERLRVLAARARESTDSLDALLVPTASRPFTIAEMHADPFAGNAELGRYTTFANLLDLAGVAVPAGFTSTGAPFGVTLLADAGDDGSLLDLAMSLERLQQSSLGATAHVAWKDDVRLAVVGAHLRGMPLHHELEAVGAAFEGESTTSAEYALYALEGSDPAKPGLVRVGDGGASITVELYRVPRTTFGGFVAGVPAPLCIGTLRLADRSTALGFLCESIAVESAADISDLGGWRAYRSIGA